MLVKQDEVRAAHTRCQLEIFPDILISQLSEIRDTQFEVDRVILMKLLYVCDFVILSKVF